MWVAEFEFDGKGYSVGKYAYDHRVSALLYINSFMKNAEGDFLVNYTMFLEGSQENIDAFIEDLKAHEKVMHLKILGNRLFCQLVQDKKYAATYQNDLVFLEPIEINAKKDGHEEARIYSWNKQSLVRLSEFIGKSGVGSLKKIHQMVDPVFCVMRAQPRLSLQQKKAIDLAVSSGYYHLPRKATLEALAAMMGVTYSTYQVHLRKAERALFPFFHFISQEHRNSD